MRQVIYGRIYKGEHPYVAECLDVPIVTQGETLDETIVNLQEAVALHLADEDLAALNLAPNPTLLVIFDTCAIDRGTLFAIFRQASRYIPEADLYVHFYSE